jgi:hypothetical protein
MERNINWQNMEARSLYENKVINNLRKLKINTVWKDGDNVEERIEKCYEDLISCFISAHKDIIKERYNDENMRGKNNWWTKELTELKRNVKEAREKLRIWNNEDSLLNVKNRKREYRRCQRRSIFVFEEKKNKNIENMFVKTSKDDFWKSIRSYKEGENKHPLSKIEREELINELKKLFTMNNEEINNDAEKMNIVEIVNSHELICKQNISSMDKTYVNNEIIRKIIKELKNSNTRGHDGMNNNMLKMIFVNDLVIEKIKLFVNLILYT